MLFTRKAQAALKRPAETPATPVKEENTNSSSGNMTGVSLMSSMNSAMSTAVVTATALGSSALAIANKYSGGLNQLTPLSASLSQVTTSLAGKSPKRNARHKRLSEMRNSASMSPKKSPNRTPLISAAVVAATHASSLPAVPSIQTPPAPNLSNYEHMPDKFRVYRTNNERDVSDSEDDDMSDISGSPCSSCSGLSVSCSGSDYDSSDDDEDDEEDDEEDEDEEEVGQNNVGAAPSSAELESNDCTTKGQGNGRPMSCSGESENEENADSDTQTRSIARRTPTPSEKRLSKTTRSKQKKKPPSPPIANPQTTTSVKSSTRLAVNKQAVPRAATPTPNNLHSAMKTRKSNNNAAMTANNNTGKNKLNNVNSSSVVATSNSTLNSIGGEHLLKPPLEPLQLVWAKCRGYPWYPALILDPKTPKGYVYNGVPLPAPPNDVLALRKNYPQDMEVFLVLFFDAKRTWQWLPANKLDILGIDKQLDQQKLVESRKPTERKAVKKAYQDALHYQSQVSDLEGQGPDPIM